jgi:cob(I)alamin adenosyltransferase
MKKIYTRTGDIGSTALIGGKRVKKSHQRIEAYGTIDELNACFGVLRSYIVDETSHQNIIRIQKQLFVIGAHLATELTGNEIFAQEEFEDEIKFLETEIYTMEINLTPMKHFVLPGGHIVSGQCNLVRTICRRAERRINALAHVCFIENWILRYINRLSDYLFVLSRFFSKKFE